MASVPGRCSSLRAMCVALAYVMAAFAQPVFAERAGEIRVTAVHGDVQVRMAGVTTPLAANAVLQLPATIRTGADGAVELRQGPTTIAAAGSSELLIPESAAQEGLIERIVQLSGNAFYNVGKRETTKLRVETPHLVAVIKGTQFNVAAQSESTTIALYEGRLEVRAPDDSDVIDLHAGEIAIRKRNDVSIRVLRMSAAAVSSPGAGAAAPAAASSADGERTANVDGDVQRSSLAPEAEDAQLIVNRADIDLAATDAMSAGSTSAAIERSELSLSADVGGQPEIGADAALDVSQGLQADAQAGLDLGGASAGVDVGVDVGGSGVAANVDVSTDLDGVTADLGVSAGVGGGAIDVGADAGVGAGPISADVGASVGVDAGGVDVGVDVGAGAGPVTADVGADVGVGAGGVDIGADVGVGGTDVGVSADVAVDPNAGQLGADVGVDTPVAGVETGVSVEDSGVTVDAGVGGAIDVDLGVGTGGVDVSTDTGVAPVDDVVDTVDDLLDGLLTPRRRK